MTMIPEVNSEFSASRFDKIPEKLYGYMHPKSEHQSHLLRNLTIDFQHGEVEIQFGHCHCHTYLS